MINDKIENSKKLAEYFVRFYKNNEDLVYKENAQIAVKNEVNLLVKLDPSNKDYALGLLTNVELSDKDLLVKEEVITDENNIINENDVSSNNDITNDSTTDITSNENENSIFDTTQANDEKLKDEYAEANLYVNSEILNGNDSNMEKNFNDLLEQLENDMENPNDNLIETWINNYKNFISTYELDEKIMYNYMENLFVNKYDYEIDRFKDIYFQEKEENELEENEPVNNESIETPSNSDINNPEETEETLSEEPSNVEVNKKEDKSVEKEDELLVDSDTKENIEDENLIEESPIQEKTFKETEVQKLKIINVERPNKKIPIMPLAIGAMLFVGPTISLTLTGVLGWIGVSKAADWILNGIRNKKYPSKLLKVLNENGFDIKYNNEDKSGILVDKETGKEVVIVDDSKLSDVVDKKVITKSEIDKERYDKIKKELVDMGAVKLTEQDYLKEGLGVLSYKHKVNHLLKLMMYKAKNLFNNKKTVIKENVSETKEKLREKILPTFEELQKQYSEEELKGRTL